MTFQGIGHCIMRETWAGEDEAKCIDKIWSYLEDGITDKLRSDPVCRTTKVMDVTKPCNPTNQGPDVPDKYGFKYTNKCSEYQDPPTKPAVKKA